MRLQCAQMWSRLLIKPIEHVHRIRSRSNLPLDLFIVECCSWSVCSAVLRFAATADTVQAMYTVFAVAAEHSSLHS
jgi:hypothetical protein